LCGQEPEDVVPARLAFAGPIEPVIADTDSDQAKGRQRWWRMPDQPVWHETDTNLREKSSGHYPVFRTKQQRIGKLFFLISDIL